MRDVTMLDGRPGRGRQRNGTRTGAPARRLLAASAAGLCLALGGVAPAVAAAPQGHAASLTVAGPVPSTTGTTPYVGGTSIDWNAESIPLTGPLPPNGGGGALTGVASGPDGFVAVGSDVSKPTGPASSGVAASWTSADGGTTWTEHLVPATTGFGMLAAHEGVYVASGPEGFWSSRDGATWTPATSGPSSTANWVTLAPGLAGFVAIVSTGPADTSAWTSADGSSWGAAPAQSSLAGFCPIGLAASTSRAVAVGYTCGSLAGHILVSTDGRTWSAFPMPAGMGAGASVSFVGGRFVIIAPYHDATHDGTAVWSSTTGLEWSRTSFLTARAPSPDLLGSVVPFGAGWITTGWAPNGADDCTPIAWWTADLVHWSRAVLPTPAYPGTCAQPAQTATSGDTVIAAGRTWATDYTWPAAWAGTLVTAPQPSLSLSEASAVGVTTSGPFTLSTKVVRKGHYVTIRIATSPALAGADIGIWVAKKGVDGTWSAFSPHTGRIANAQGVVDYFYRAQSIAWLSFQAHVYADGAHPATVSNAVQARWVP